MAEKKAAQFSSSSVEEKRKLIEPDHLHLRVRRQGALVGLTRATFYLVPAQETSENLQWMRLLAVDR